MVPLRPDPDGSSHDDERDRRLAGRRARATPGVVDVCNMLIVSRVSRP